MRVKLFDSSVNVADLENKIAEWSKDLNPVIISVNFQIHLIHDYWHNTAPPMICNQWHEWTAVIVYEIPTVS
jgi:hypothetical protein